MSTMLKSFVMWWDTYNWIESPGATNNEAIAKDAWKAGRKQVLMEVKAQLRKRDNKSPVYILSDLVRHLEAE